MYLYEFQTISIMFYEIALIVYIVLIGFTILRYRQNKAQGHLYLLVPMILQTICAIFVVASVLLFICAYTSVLASYLTVEIVLFHSILWAKSMKKHIGTKTAKFFEVIFYFWMLVYIAVAVIICIFDTFALDDKIVLGIKINSNTTTIAIIPIISYILGIVGSVFGFFCTIAYVMLIPKSVAKYGNQKNLQAVRLMIMYILLIVAAFLNFTTFFAIIALILLYILTLTPMNAMQNYTATPEECAPKIPSSFPGSIQEIVPVVIQIPQGQVPANTASVYIHPPY